jgi:hypothetical protein
MQTLLDTVESFSDWSGISTRTGGWGDPQKDPFVTPLCLLRYADTHVCTVCSHHSHGWQRWQRTMRKGGGFRVTAPCANPILLNLSMRIVDSAESTILALYHKCARIASQVCTRLHARPRQVMYLEDETASLGSLLRVRGLASPLAIMQLGCLGRCRLFRASLLPSDSRTHESEPNDRGVDKKGCGGSKPEGGRKMRLKSRVYGTGKSDTKTRVTRH